LEFGNKLCGNLFIRDYQQILIILCLRTVGKVVGTQYNNALLNNHHLVMHLPCDAFDLHCDHEKQPTQLIKLIKLCADTGSIFINLGRLEPVQVPDDP
jgi:hypothetical protein